MPGPSRGLRVRVAFELDGGFVLSKPFLYSVQVELVAERFHHLACVKDKSHFEVVGGRQARGD